jgi:hypothetical protein
MRRLIERLFRPERVLLPDALITACAALSPTAAWTALHEQGVLPASWLDAPRRRFPWLPDLPAHERNQRLRAAPYVPVAQCPDSSADCILVASTVVAMERAEAHASTFIRALAPWGYPTPDTFVWLPTARDKYDNQIHDTKPGVWDPNGCVWRVFPRSVTSTRWKDLAQGLRADAGRNVSTDALQTVAIWLFGNEQWLAAVEQGDRVPRDGAAGARGQRYADLENPFACGIAIFSCGFGLLPCSDTSLALGYPTRAS